MPSPHTCPAPGCYAQVPSHMLMCPNHWHQLPIPVRNEVWAAWQNGRGAGTRRHRAAVAAAIESLRRPQNDA